MIRSYDPEYTRSRPISEVKQDSAGPVLWTEMTREAPVPNLLLPRGVVSPSFFFFAPSTPDRRGNGQGTGEKRGANRQNDVVPLGRILLATQTRPVRIDATLSVGGSPWSQVGEL